jgi:hypothetical protein
MRRINVFLSFVLAIALLATGCTQGVTPASSRTPAPLTTTESSANPTGPDLVLERGIGVDELLKDLALIDWQDIHSVTVRKFVDDVDMGTTVIKDEEKFDRLEVFLGTLSVVHKTTELSEPAENIVYEIVFNMEGSDADDGQFISFGPVYEDGIFAIGGTFIATQKLNPRMRLVQTNPFVTFDELEETMLLLGLE